MIAQVTLGGEAFEIRRTVVGQAIIECVAPPPWEVGCALLVQDAAREVAGATRSARR